MIQRIQTVYLLLACILSFVLFFTPVSMYKNETRSIKNIISSQKIVKFNLRGLIDVSGETEKYVTSITAAPLLNGGILILAIAAIFLFRKRSFQMHACKLLIFLNCLLLAIFIFYVERVLHAREHVGPWSITYLIGTYLPIAGIFFLYLAHGAIKRDDNLVRSAERLR